MLHYPPSEINAIIEKYRKEQVTREYIPRIRAALDKWRKYNTPTVSMLDTSHEFTAVPTVCFRPDGTWYAVKTP